MRQVTSILCAILALVFRASGSTYVVEPDGSGDFPTVQAALGAAVDGDTIELGEGTFSGYGNRDIDFLGKAVTVRSASGGASACIIDCAASESDQHRGFIFQTGEGAGSVVEGVTIANGWVDTYGAGIFCDETASPTISHCTLYRNASAFGGGMCGGAASMITGCSFVENAAVRGGGLARVAHADLTGCVFVGNSGTYGGAIYLRSGCSPNLTRCVFDHNTASHSGGAIHIELHSNPTLSHCTLAGNSAPIGGAVDVSIECSPVFENCTLLGNSCGYTGVIACYELCALTFENCIIGFSKQGQAVSCADSEATLTCCDVYGNPDGDWAGYIADQYGTSGNICEDPLFCGDENPDAPYGLHDASPCAPAQNPSCGLIGAWGVACGATPIERAGWGAIKAMYR